MKVDQIFKQNIKNILTNGSVDKNPRAVWADGTPAHSYFITQVFETYDLTLKEFPITSLRKIPWKSAIKEIFWIYQDQSNDLPLLREKYGIYWWDLWESKQIPDTIGKRYGHTIHKHGQMHNLINGIKADPYGRRHIMTLWDWDDFRSSDGLFPCAYETLWAVRDNLLDCTLVQRSSDYLVANHINKIQYVALQMMVAAECGLSVGKFSHFVNNLHIYDRHVEAAKALLELPDPYEQPILSFDASVPFISASIENFSLTKYDPMLLDLKLELAV